MREYGGLKSGRPSGICGFAAWRLHVKQVAVERRVGRAQLAHRERVARRHVQHARSPDRRRRPTSSRRRSCPAARCVPSTDGGVKSGPVLNPWIAFSAIARISGVKSARSSTVTPWYSNGAGFDGIGCVGDAFSPGTSDARHRLLVDRPHRLAGHAIERVDVALLGDLRERLDARAVHGDVEQVRRGRIVVVPQARDARSGNATRACRC